MSKTGLRKGNKLEGRVDAITEEINMKRLLATLLIAVAFPIAAQEYPAKTVRIIVPFPAGGSTDVLARSAAQMLNKIYGQLFVVENRPGATGTIAGAFVAKAAPDGYTQIMHSVSTYTAGYLYSKLSYDASTAFAPVINCVVNPFIVVAASGLPTAKIGDLVAIAKKRPNELTFATVGMGSGAHLVSEMFNTAAGIKTVAVAYKGSVPALSALASGETAFAINNIMDTKGLMQQGKIKALAITGAKRTSATPGVPTLLESGINVEANLWTGLFTTAGTPRAVVGKLNDELARYLDTAATREWLLTSLGGEYTPNTPEQFAAFLASDTGRWKSIIQQMKIKLD